MRILMVHDYYQQPGGEDVIYESESDLLESRGHSVYRAEFNNSTIPEKRSLRASAGIALSAIWSRSAQTHLQQVIQEFEPDLAHFHNTFPLVSPAAYVTCQNAGIPVVQTLQNYRVFCPSATTYRDGKSCLDCLGRNFAWPGVLHACYRDSRAVTATVATMQATHRLLGTWKNKVDIYVAMSEPSREIFLKAGFHPDSITVKPNFVSPDHGAGNHSGGHVIFVGRLSREKGIGTLLRAWDQVRPGVKLKIVGDGPLRDLVVSAAEHNPAIEWLGRQSLEETLGSMGEASLLVFSSEWNETFGRTMMEAFSRGTPVLAANLGAALELVRPGVTGYHFEAGNRDDLAEKVNWLFEHPMLLNKLSNQSRKVFEREYSAEANYPLLLEVYQRAMDRQALKTAPLKSWNAG